jgi:hypothetical protein
MQEGILNLQPHIFAQLPDWEKDFGLIAVFRAHPGNARLHLPSKYRHMPLESGSF